MSNHEKSLEGPKDDHRNIATVEDREALSQNQWTSMRDGRTIGGSASGDDKTVGGAASGDASAISGSARGAISRVFDLEKDLNFDPEKSGGFKHIVSGLSEREKERIITSAVRGAETARDLADVKHLEQVLDHRKGLEDRPYIDCGFGNIYKNMKAEEAAGRGYGEFGGAKSGGAIGFKLSGDGGGSIARKVADAALDTLESIGDGKR